MRNIKRILITGSILGALSLTAGILIEAHFNKAQPKDSFLVFDDCQTTAQMLIHNPTPAQWKQIYKDAKGKNGYGERCKVDVSVSFCDGKSDFHSNH